MVSWKNFGYGVFEVEDVELLVKLYDVFPAYIDIVEKFAKRESG